MTKGEERGKNERGVLLHRIALISNRDSARQSISHSFPVFVYSLFPYLRDLEPEKNESKYKYLVKISRYTNTTDEFTNCFIHTVTVTT